MSKNAFAITTSVPMGGFRNIIAHSPLAERLRISPLQLELARTLLLERSEPKTLLATAASPRTASVAITRILREAPLVVLGKLHVASRGG
jgi:hypothetical protein